MNKNFWKGKKVLVTGHTGFKGSWLVMMLNHLGARTYGYSMSVPTNPSVFELCQIRKLLDKDIRGDIRDLEEVKKFFREVEPEIVFHMAAQPLVRPSYRDPFTTYSTNVMGTLNVLMMASETDSVRSVVNITTDKCYENREWSKGYVEEDYLGGYDPYSSSKACAEVLTSSLRRSFYIKKNKNLATVRAGNVIGGGDWAAERIIPDFMRSYESGTKLEIRNPGATRPWQHVMEPLRGYMLVAERLAYDSALSEAWNFGPEESDCQTVQFIVNRLLKELPEHPGVVMSSVEHPHEATFLKLDWSKAKARLGWHPKTSLTQALTLTAHWYKASFKSQNILDISMKQIEDFLKS
jgi:CDP-glucose 4,6-dehydratase